MYYFDVVFMMLFFYYYYLNIVLCLIPQLFVINYRPLWFALALGSSILDTPELSKVYNMNIPLEGFIFTNLHTKAYGHWSHLSREDAFCGLHFKDQMDMMY